MSAPPLNSYAIGAKPSTAAFFDVDGTVVRANIIRYYAFLRTDGMGPLRKALWIAGFLPRIPYYFVLDKISRRLFNSAFYRNYTDIDPAELEMKAEIHFREFMQPRIYAGAVARMLEHRKNGDLIVLITGSLEPIVWPLAQRLQITEVVAARLRQQDGTFTGELERGPITGKRKAESLREVAAKHNLPPSHCYAYGDSMDDLPMLTSVGHAAVVNPRRRLRKIAEAKGWEILEWRL